MVDVAERERLIPAARRLMRTKHFSLLTEEAYVRWIVRDVRFHQMRHPRTLGERQMREFLSHLAADQNVAASTQSQALAALLFLYVEVLRDPVPWIADVVRARRPARLPVVMTREEVRAVLGKMRGSPKLVALLLYGSGLRLMEALRLRVKDVDFGMNQITVRGGKGDRDRVTMLPVAARTDLERQLVRVRRQHERDLAAGRGGLSFRTPWRRSIRTRPRSWGGSGSSPRGGSRLTRRRSTGIGIICTRQWCSERCTWR